MDLKKAPKQFCDNIQIGFSEDFFVMAVYSGESAGVFTLTPQHAKRLLQYLQHNVENYEEQHGTIEAEWTPNVKSPLQTTDLEGPTEDGDTSAPESQ